MKTVRRMSDESLLVELTQVPTAAGREGRIVARIERWVKARRQVRIERDTHGNLMLSRRIKTEKPVPEARRRAGSTTKSSPPIILVAHMDHPAFVVRSVEGKSVWAEFRGGVQDSFFVGTKVRLRPVSRKDASGPVGTVAELFPADSSQSGSFKTARIAFKQAPPATPGDVITWDLGRSIVKRGRLHAPACDDLAALAAGLAACDVLWKQRGVHNDVRLLCTRSEEIGFIGAIGACRSGIIPRDARVIVLENSKSFAESPIDGGPIVRVGDRTSTFDPALTAAVGQVAAHLQQQDKTFTWQRKLMPGGTCEATAYQAYGHTATCVCLPLGNYHNMNEATGRIEREVISLADFHGLVRLLTALGTQLDDPATTPPLTQRLDKLFADHAHVLAT